MMADERRRELVRRYYETAPALVAQVDARADRMQVYGQLHSSFILPAVAALEVGDDARAEEVYSSMLEWLTDRLRQA
jgi:hypothetical protein